jgi:hypothetical protein
MDQTVEKSNRDYFKLLSYIETAKNNDLSQYVREESIANMINQMSPSGPAANWISIKDGFFDIMIDDPDFFFSAMLSYPDQLESLMKNFSLNWLYKGESEYPEKKQLALKVLKKYIKTEKRKLEASIHFNKIIENTEPDVLH